MDGVARTTRIGISKRTALASILVSLSLSSTHAWAQNGVAPAPPTALVVCDTNTGCPKPPPPGFQLPPDSTPSDTFYVTDRGRGDGTGESQSDAMSLSAFQNRSFARGQTVYFCGRFDRGDNAIDLEGGSGSSGYVVYRGDCPGDPGILHMTYGEKYAKAISIQGVDGIWLHAFELTGTIYHGFLIRDSRDIKIGHMQMTNYGSNYGISVGGKSGSGVHDLEIFANHIERTILSGVGTGNCIQLSGFVTNMKVYNNILGNWGHDQLQVLTEMEFDNFEVYNNRFTLPTVGYARAFAFGAAKNVNFHHNYIEPTRTRNKVYGGENIFIHNNVFAEAKNYCRADDDYGCTRAYTNTDKTYYGTGSHLVIGKDYADRDVKNLRVYNNSFGPSAEGTFTIRYDGPAADGVYIRNNIIYDNVYGGTIPGGPWGSRATSRDHTFVMNRDNVHIENNIVSNPPDAQNRNPDFIIGDEIKTLAKMQADSPFVNDNLKVDPGFVNVPAAGSYEFESEIERDFRLRSDSAAIDAGATLGDFYAGALCETATLPPSTPTLTNQNDHGTGWEIGAFVYGGCE